MENSRATEAMKEVKVMAFHIAEELKLLPEKPGVYLMKDAEDRIIYVGKAVNLRSRVRSYFQSRHLDTKTVLLVQNIVSFETIVVTNEVEALVLESNLIKRHQPHFNILLKDDHHFPFLRLNVQDPFPRLTMVHKTDKDGARYFGPYPGRTIQPTVEALRSLFPLRTCTRILPATTEQRACLDYHIKRCLGPCIGAIDAKAYAEMVEAVILFLEGKTQDLLRYLHKEMERASEAMAFEKAASLRDQIKAVQRISERQRVEDSTGGDKDIIGLARTDNDAQVAVLFFRDGKIVGKSNFALLGSSGQDRSEIMTMFVQQFYLTNESIPPEIWLQDPLLPTENETIKAWISDRRQAKVDFVVPQRGDKVELIELAAKNALEALSCEAIKRDNSKQEAALALEELAEALQMPQAPWRIEAYDISNTQGTNSVASMVVFEHGLPAKREYRRFRIKLVEGPNDFASMQEVISRRFTRATQERDALNEGRLLQTQIKFGKLPALVLIDGGKGQLHAARDVMKELGYAEIPTIGLAKQFELIFVEGVRAPIALPERSRALRLLQRIRDEAHRYAITYHRHLRGNAALSSDLEQIPGIGKTRVRLLLKHFGGLDKIALATVRELADLPGMNVKSAEAVADFMRRRYEEQRASEYAPEEEAELSVADKPELFYDTFC